MKNTNKAMRILAVVALVLCLFVLLGVTAFAADETTNIKDTDVAAIGNQGYATLQAAISAVKNDETIKLLADSNESVSISVKDKNITIDGNNKTYTGMISLSEGNGKTLTIKNATLMPTNVAFTVNVAKSSNWSVVVDTCTCVSTTDKWSTTKSYAIVYGTQTDNLSITIQNCPEITGFYYLAAFSQGGKSLTIDNCNDITDCVYLVSAGKCNVVTIKDVIYSGEAGMLMKGEGNAKTLNIEDSTITFTNETYPYNPVYISNSTSLVTAYVTGVNQFVDASGNAYEDLTWTNLPANKLNIEAQNGTKFGSLKAIAADAKPGDTVKLLADVTAENLGEVDVTGLTIDLGGKKITISDSNDLVFVGDNFTITNGTFETVNTYALWIGGDNAASNVTVENVTVNGGIEIRNANNVKITGENTVVTGKIEAVIAEGNNTVVSIYNGTYGNENEQHHVLAAGAGAKIYVYGGYFCCVVKEEYCAEGLVPTTTPDANGYYTVKTSAVAKVNGVEYSSLQAAIDAAPAGATVYLVADVTENNVTISDSIVIDGYKTADSNYTYTGSITIIVKNADVTINNVDFVKGNLVSDNSDGTEIELVGCNFDGQKAVQFATKAGHLEQLRITDCSIKNYTLGAVYISLQNSKNTIITDTVIDTMGAYAIAVVYGSAAELNGVTIKNTNGGLVAGTARDYILTDCVFENVRQPIAAWSGSVTGTFTFYGDNKAPNLYTNQGGTFVLATNATLIAPAGLDVTTDVTGGVVIYEDGKYSVKMGLAGSGTEADPYQIGSLNDLIMFRDSVNAGETKYNAEGVYVVLTANIDLAGIDWSVNIGDACNATFDGIFDGKGYTISNLTSTETTQMGDGYVCTGLFGAISGNAVIKNLTIDNANINTGTFTGNNAAAVVGFAWAATGTIENVKVTNSTINAVKIDGVGAIVGYAYGGNLTIANCEVTNTTVNGQSYVGGVIGYATAGALNGNTVTGTTVTANSAAAGGVAGIFYKGTTAANNTVKNTTITSNHDNWKNAAGVVVGSYVGNAVVSGTTAEDNNVTAIVGVLHAEKPTAPLAKTQAKIGDTYYATFKAAYDAAQNGDTITLLDDVTTSETITITKSITLDGNGKTITYTGSNRAIDVPNNATAKVNVTIKDLAVAFTGYSERGINYNDDGTLALENVIVNAEGKSVTYALNLPGSSDKATVVINNSALTGNIALNVWGENATITANNTVFTSVDYSTAEGYTAIKLNNDGTTYANGTIVTINGGKIVAYNEKGEPSTATSNATATGKIIVNGAEVIGSNITPVAIVTYGGNQFYSFATLQSAIDKVVKDGKGTVELIADVTTDKTITINGSVTILGNGYTVTYTGSNRAIDVPNNATAKVNVTIKDLAVAFTGYSERGINYNDDGTLALENVIVNAEGKSVTYALNLPGSSDKATVVINNSALTGNIALNVWGENATITANNTVFTSVDYSTAENYSAVVLNNDGSTVANGTIVTINGGKIIAKDQNGDPSNAVRNATATGKVNVSENTEVVGAIVAPVAIVTYGGDQFYSCNTLQAAINKAIATNGNVELLADITASDIIVVNGSVVIDGNGYTLTSTAARAINVATDGNVTIKDLTIKASGERAINVITAPANLTIDNVTATAANYTVNVAASAGAAKVAVKNSNLTGLNVVNVAGAGAVVTVADTTLTTVDNADEGYSMLALNKDAIGGKIEATNVTFVITGSNCGNTVKATNQAENGVITIDGKTDEVDVDVAYISYGNNWYGFTTLAAAIEFAKEGETVVLLRDITMDTMIVNTKKITLDLNGKTITGTDNTTKNFSLIDNRGELTITGNGKMTLKATVNSGWNRYSAVIANNPGGKLVVENGTIEHLGGTDMAYGIDNLTNGKGTYAETIINGGTIKSTYRAVRQFLNGVEAQNILTINGGTIEGANKAIFFHDPSKNANTGTLTVGANAVLNGDVYLFVTAGSTTWPVEVSIADSALNGEIVTGNVPEQYLVEKTNGTWNVNKYEAWLKNHGYVATLVEAIKIANERGISGGEYIYLLCDSEGPGFVTTTYIGIFFEGYTYTITSGVGSKGTESNGIQQLRGALVLRNGTLKVAESAADTMYILIQSYDKLTLTSMTVDGTNLDKWSKTDGDSYVISKNNGSLAINTVDIITNDDGDKAFAFDLCDQRDKGYMTLPSASTSANCTINGQPIAQMTDKIEAVAKYSVYYYATIEQAMAKHPSVTLIRNVEGPGIVIDKNVTIDFNGYTYTITSGVGSKGTESNGFQILAGNKVTLKNGTLTVAESAKHEIGILIQNYANLTISNMKLSDENLEKDEYPYVLSNNSGNVTLNSGTVITVNSANGVAFDAYAMKGYTAPVVEVYSSCKIPADKIEAVAKIDNKYYSTFEQAIEATKAGGTVNLLCDMKGPGVVIDKNITINFNGHTYAFTSGVGSNGTETNGFQILAGNTVTLKNGTLKVDGSAAGDMGILIQNYANLTIDNMELIGENLNKASYSYTLSVNSGNVTLKNGTIVSANTVGNGIAFDVYAMKGYELPVVTVNSSCKINGKIDAPARISTKYYATFAQAVEASYGNDVITLLGDVTTPGIVIDKRLTVDFAGKTLTFVGAAVGSTGTTTNGFQILAGNKVTLKNGTLEVAESAASNYAMLIQNYANLTLTDMVLDGTNLDYSAKTSYTLSINSGKVVIEGETKIIANDRNLTADYAFDVYDYSSAGYALPVLNDLSSGAFTWEGNTLAAAKIKFNDTTTTYYATLQQAVDACKSVTVVLLEDIVLKDTLVIANQTVKLDLAGYTISQEKACTESYAMIVNNGTLTINDTVGGGKISFKDTGAGDPNFTWGSYTIVNNKKLTVNAGTIENITELNTAAKNVHMYCAIQQNVATASTTISGGTISTPTYRSIRINQGKLSVSGGIIDGQIWVQPFAANCSVTVTGGTIGPNGGDASALFIENAKYAVTLKVSGGKFEGKIGCSKPDELVAKVTKCTFTTEAAKENTNAVLFSKTAKITVEEN